MEGSWRYSQHLTRSKKRRTSLCFFLQSSSTYCDVNDPRREGFQARGFQTRVSTDRSKNRTRIAAPKERKRKASSHLVRSHGSLFLVRCGSDRIVDDEARSMFGWDVHVLRTLVHWFSLFASGGRVGGASPYPRNRRRDRGDRREPTIHAVFGRTDSSSGTGREGGVSERTRRGRFDPEGHGTERRWYKFMVGSRGGSGRCWRRILPVHATGSCSSWSNASLLRIPSALRFGWNDRDRRSPTISKPW